jgi:pimeloyl-ACP methyl ester carboxylesterase
VPVVGELARTFVSLVRPYPGMHFTAASEVKSVGPRQAGQLGASFDWYRAHYDQQSRQQGSPRRRPPVEKPKVVRWGELGPIKSPLWAEGIEETFPELDFRFVAVTGHFIPFEAPEETLAAVRTAIEIIH